MVARSAFSALACSAASAASCGLNDAISEKNKENHSDHLAGNISKSELIEDKDNWFFESSLKKLIEKKEKSQIEKLKLEPFWVNYQKQNEFNPLHNHSGLYSFVVFMKIPTHWKEQHALNSYLQSHLVHTFYV